MSEQPDHDYHELARRLLAQLFEEHMDAEQWQALREALETRLERLDELAAGGASDQALRTEIRQQLQALKEEELIARFVEEALAATLAYQDLKQQMEEGEG